VRIARKHIGWYLQGLGRDAAAESQRQRLMAAETADEQLALLREHFQRLAEAATDRMLAA
jgi:tRNA-dihydrouridine synthase B